MEFEELEVRWRKDGLKDEDQGQKAIKEAL